MNEENWDKQWGKLACHLLPTALHYQVLPTFLINVEAWLQVDTIAKYTYPCMRMWSRCSQRVYLNILQELYSFTYVAVLD